MTFQEAKFQMRKTGCWVTCDSFSYDESCHFYRGDFYLEDGAIVTEEAEQNNDCFQNDDWYIKYSADRIDQFGLCLIHEKANGYTLSAVKEFNSYEEAVFPNSISIPFEKYADVNKSENINIIQKILNDVTLSDCIAHYNISFKDYDGLCEYMLHHKKVKLSEDQICTIKPMLYYFLISNTVRGDLLTYIRKKNELLDKEQEKLKKATKWFLYHMITAINLLLGLLNIGNGSKLLGYILLLLFLLYFNQYCITTEPNKKYFQITKDIKIPILISLVDYFRFICLVFGMLILVVFNLPIWMQFISTTILTSPFFFMGIKNKIKED